jgi:hypothetical protein
VVIIPLYYTTWGLANEQPCGSSALGSNLEAEIYRYFEGPRSGTLDGKRRSGGLDLNAADKSDLKQALRTTIYEVHERYIFRGRIDWV